ncbi:MAG TPA: VanZ family protein [Burkholderiales bacterium]|nr:VanZ family protein [Burkholderiales bacterium]
MYALLVAYATLHPLEGWQDHGQGAFDYLTARWPAWIVRFDVAANVLGYAPFGFLCVAALYPRLRGLAAFVLALAAGAALCVLLEAVQSYLPTRIASNVDVFANIAGTLLGAAAGVRLSPWLLEHGPYRRWRAAAFLPGHAIDFGLVLLALWLFLQLNPATLLFGAGDLRELVVEPGLPARGPEYFASIEALTAAANLVVVALLLSTLVTPGYPVRWPLAALAATALLVKSLGSAAMREDALAWLTPGAEQGLIFGMVVALGAVSLPRTARLVLAAVLIMAATVLVNLAPPNPYFAATLRAWQPGHFLNFNGLTRLVSAAWPFLALGYLIFLATRGRGRGGSRSEE